MASTSGKCVHRAPTVSVYRSRGHRYTFFSCLECGAEWQEQETVEDLADTVSANEIIEVHRLLRQHNKTLGEMTD